MGVLEARVVQCPGDIRGALSLGASRAGCEDIRIRRTEGIAPNPVHRLRLAHPQPAHHPGSRRVRPPLWPRHSYARHERTRQVGSRDLLQTGMWHHILPPASISEILQPQMPDSRLRCKAEAQGKGQSLMVMPCTTVSTGQIGKADTASRLPGNGSGARVMLPPTREKIRSGYGRPG